MNTQERKKRLAFLVLLIMIIRCNIIVHYRISLNEKLYPDVRFPIRKINLKGFKMRHILTFKTNMPESTEYTHPKGYSICKLLEEELVKKGVEVQPLDNYRDIAWSIDCQINNKPVFFFVGYLGTKQTDWQLIVCSHSGFLRCVFGHKDIDERIYLANEIHNILSKDNRFTDLKWFSRYTDRPSDEWRPTP